jgi:DNA-binding IclR family transcriptional regulator
MSITTEDANRILNEIQLDKEPARPDTTEEAAFREQLEKECDEIRSQGYVVDVPPEIPG